MTPLASTLSATPSYQPSGEALARPGVGDRQARIPAEERAMRTKITRNSKELVAGALLMPILSEARATRQKGGPFGVSKVEERFGPVFDRELANAIVERGGFPVVDHVERAMLQRAKLDPLPAPTLRDGKAGAALGTGVVA